MDFEASSADAEYFLILLIKINNELE